MFCLTVVAVVVMTPLRRSISNVSLAPCFPVPGLDEALVGDGALPPQRRQRLEPASMCCLSCLRERERERERERVMDRAECIMAVTITIPC